MHDCVFTSDSENPATVKFFISLSSQFLCPDVIILRYEMFLLVSWCIPWQSLYESWLVSQQNYVAITRKDRVITRKLSRNYEKIISYLDLFRNYEIFFSFIKFEFSFLISMINFLKSFTLEVSDTSASRETGAIAGSVIGTFVLLTTAIVLVYFARRRYKCTCEKSNVSRTVKFR